MSKGLFANWRFRTSTPSFEPGDLVEVYLTAFDASTGEGEARIGDSVLKVSGATADQVDRLVTLRVASFDPQGARGTAAMTGD
ncbi:MAG: hypothetical protein HND55_13230 [Pseudomonadota bacterium]|nr:MAG: hypothetical protein HND55_13230 [Pseudomonadota bacterium]